MDQVKNHINVLNIGYDVMEKYIQLMFLNHIIKQNAS